MGVDAAIATSPNPDVVPSFGSSGVGAGCSLTGPAVPDA